MIPSSARVARTWNNDLMRGQVALLKEEVQRFHTAVQTKHILAPYRWNDLIRAGRPLAPWILETRAVPKGKEKAIEMAVRVVLSASRTPRDLSAWVAKNQRHIDTFLEATTWPEKGAAAEGSEEAFPLAGFIVHNTLNLTGSGLEATKGVIEKAVKVLRSMTSVPRVASILYGNLFIVGRLTQPRTMAWYNLMADEVYLRPHLKFGPGEIHNLLHELAHRYWAKVMPREHKSYWATYHMLLQFQRPDVVMPVAGDVFPIPIKGEKTQPLVERVEGGQIFLVGGGSVDRFKVLKMLQSKASYPTDYASTDAEEHFAEAFAMYGLGTLKPANVAAFEAIVIRGEAYRPGGELAAKVASRWLSGSVLWRGTVADLIAIVFPWGGSLDVNPDGTTTYKGTNIPLRKVPMGTVIEVDDQGRIEDHQGGWIADRLGGRFGARQRRLLRSTG